jgi:hypothetical protein
MCKTKRSQVYITRRLRHIQKVVHHGGIALVGWTMLLLCAFSFAQDPSVQVLCPKEGAAFRVGSTLTVQWALRNQARPDGGVAILFSPDEGMSWHYLTNPMKNEDTAIYRDSIGTFNWTIADSVRLYGTVYMHMASTQCIVKVEAPYDESFIPGTSNIFSISPSTRAVQSGRNDIGNHRAVHETRSVNGLIETDKFGKIGLDGRRQSASGKIRKRSAVIPAGSTTR